MSVSQQRELREYLQVLNRQKVLILVVTAVVTIGSLGVALLQTPVYRATAELLFESGSARLIVNPASQR
ncbi:MAG: Wzz/FepE/Etk N-terminal domain-containing protein, partial [Actinomycetota bacterium]